jgi:hypothetical protein
VSELYHNKALPKGTILREWRLEQVLGVGGFGIVYRAKGVYFDELVAIKEYFPGAISDRLDNTTVTPTDSSAEEVYKLGLQKFVEEAKVLWNLSKPTRHPNIVSVRSLFEIHGTAYMVMDFESGVSLSQMLRDGHRFDETELLNLIKPIAEGLDRAHRGGVLHRDIKPANILVDETGRPVLIDFGSARFESGQATSTKVTFYTPPYAAIEQYVKTYPQGPWTDIYALGVVLYQCVTGEKPPEVLERLHGGLGEALSSRPRPGFSQRFTRAVDAAMAIRPSERPQSIPDWLRMFETDIIPVDSEATRIVTRIAVPQPAAKPPVEPVEQAPAPVAAAASVEAVEDQPAGTAAAPRPIRSRKALIGAGGAAAAALIGISIFLFWPAQREAAQPEPAAVAPEQAQTQDAQNAQPAQTAVPALPDIPFDSLLTKAREAQRPDAEITKLGNSRSKFQALMEKGRSIAATPDAAKNLPPVIAELNQTSVEASRSEADALASAEAEQWKQIQDQAAPNSAPEAGRALAAVKDAKGKLDAALVSVVNSKDAANSINAAVSALAAYGVFQTSYDAAAGVFVVARLSAKKQQYAAQDASLRQIAQKVIGLSAADKPGFLASRARKDAYQLLQDNATQAKAQITRLDDVSRTVSAASDLSQLDAATQPATDIEGSLSRLVSSSTTASDQLNR